LFKFVWVLAGVPGMKDEDSQSPGKVLTHLRKLSHVKYDV